MFFCSPDDIKYLLNNDWFYYKKNDEINETAEKVVKIKTDI